MIRNRVIPFGVLLSLLIPFGRRHRSCLHPLWRHRRRGGGRRRALGKNRDLAPEEEQALVRKTPRLGPAFVGIISRKSGRITAGVNDKGLVVVNASASSVEDRTRNHIRLEKILSQAGSVEGALRLFRQEGMKSPIHYLLADPHHLALLEVFSPDRHEIK